MLGALKRHPWRSAFLAALSIATVLFIASLFIPYLAYTCAPNEYTHYKECAPHHLGPFVLFWIALVIDSHNGVVAAFAGLTVAWFTYTLWRSAEAQGTISERQTRIQLTQQKLAKAQHLAQFRPLLRVRHVSLVTGESIGNPTIFFGHGDKVDGGLIVVNVGGSRAEIISSKYRIFFSNAALPMRSPLESSGDVLIEPGVILPIGHSHGVGINDIVDLGRMAVAGTDTMIVLHQFDRGGYTVYVIGEIEYSDDGGNHRFMGFCRSWDGKDGGFRRVRNPDYEFED